MKQVPDPVVENEEEAVVSDVAEIVVHGRHIEVSRRFREHVHNKLERIDKFGIPLRRVDVEVSKESNPRLADRAFEVGQRIGMAVLAMLMVLALVNDVSRLF